MGTGPMIQTWMVARTGTGFFWNEVNSRKIRLLIASRTACSLLIEEKLLDVQEGLTSKYLNKVEDAPCQALHQDRMRQTLGLAALE